MASSAIKRQRRRKRVDTDGDPEFQVAPMVDVLLVLMLFFMAITSTEVLKKNKNLQLADANHAKPADKTEHKNEITVNVAWDGINNVAHFDLNGKGYDTAEQMGADLAAQHNANPLGTVVIRADRDVQYSNISDLMNACGAAGIGTVSFSVLIGGDSNNKAPSTASNQ